MVELPGDDCTFKMIMITNLSFPCLRCSTLEKCVCACVAFYLGIGEQACIAMQAKTNAPYVHDLLTVHAHQHMPARCALVPKSHAKCTATAASAAVGQPYNC